MDISNFINWFIARCVEFFAYTYSMLSRITFNGISLLQFFLYILILGIVLDLFIIQVKHRAVREGRSSGKKGKQSKSKEGGSDDSK